MIQMKLQKNYMKNLKKQVRPVDFEYFSKYSRLFIFGDNVYADRIELMISARFPMKFFGFLTELKKAPRHIPSQYSRKEWRSVVNQMGAGDCVLSVSTNEDFEAEMKLAGVDVVYPFNLFSIYSSYELPTFLKFCQQYLNGEGIALDIGANNGITGSILSCFSSQVHMFEANPDMEKHIRISNNGNQNITVVMKAVSNLLGKVKVYPAGVNNMTLVPRERDKGIDVECITIDSYCTSNELFPKIIKIDVEGVDSEVILGAKSTIEKCKPYLFLEHPRFNAKTYTTNTNAVDQAMNFLESNYELLAYPTLDQLHPADSFGLPIDEFIAKVGYFPTNIACVPKEKG